jgi:hypothetical protein
MDLQISGDWGGLDFDCSKGETPDPAICNETHNGVMAVCWQNGPKFPSPAGDKCTTMAQTTRIYCTYKSKESVNRHTPINGPNPGEIYLCDKH